jgi:hypothetical protein
MNKALKVRDDNSRISTHTHTHTHYTALHYTTLQFHLFKAGLEPVVAWVIVGIHYMAKTMWTPLHTHC